VRSIPKFFSAKATDEQAVSGPCHLYGIYTRETGGAASGQIFLRDGTSTSDPTRWEVFLSASQKQSFDLFGMRFATGVFIDRSGTGTTEVTLFVAVDP
jgi:hypothetical protein